MAMKLKLYVAALLHSYTFTELINQYASENADGFWATYSLQVAAFALHLGVDDHALPLACMYVSAPLITSGEIMSYAQPHRFVLNIMSLLLK